MKNTSNTSDWIATYNIFMIALNSTNSKLYSYGSLILVLILTSLYQFASIFVMNIISSFYLAITQQNKQLFIETIIYTIIILILLTILKSLQMISIELCILIFRKNLTFYLHDIYIPFGSQYHSKQSFDNIDQRITQDSDMFCNEIINIIINLFCIPFLIIYYSFQLIILLNYIIPIICTIYFLFSWFVSSYFMNSIIHLIYKKQNFEANFRLKHINYIKNIEIITILNANNNELYNLDLSFNIIIINQLNIIKKHILLYLFTNFFDYFGSIRKLFHSF